MKSKAISSSASSAPNSVFSLEDINVSLRFENAKLKRQLAKAWDMAHYWKEKALQAQADRDYYREQAQEVKS